MLNLNENYEKSLSKGFSRTISFFNEEELVFNDNYKAFINHLTDQEYCKFVAEYGVLLGQLEDLLKKYNDLVSRRIDDMESQLGYLEYLFKNFHTKKLSEKMDIVEMVTKYSANKYGSK